MKITRLQIKDFLLFGDVDLELEDSIYSIVGRNLDQASQSSNGAGKSALMQSIGWCLFEDVRDGLLKDDVVRHGADFAQVILELEKDGRTIVVDRVRQHPERGNDVDLTVDGEPMSQHKVKETNEMIENVLGVSAKMFYHCSYSDEYEVRPPFVRLSPALMMKAVSEILGIERFDKFRSETHDLGKEFNSQRNLNEAEFVAAEKSVNYIQEQLDKARESISNFEIENAARLEVIDSKIKKKEEGIAALEAEMEECKEANVAFRNFDRSFIEELKGLDKANARRSSEIATANAEVHRARAEVRSVKEALSELTQQYDNIANNTSGYCNYCGGELEMGDDLLDRIKEAEKKMATQGDEILAAEAKLKKRESEAKKLKKTQEAEEARLAELQAVRDEYEALKDEAQAYQILNTQLGKENEALMELRNRRKEIAKGRIDELKKMASELRRDLKEANKEAEEALKRLEQSEADYKATELLKKALTMAKAGVLNAFIMDLVEAINGNLEKITEGDFRADLDLKKDSLVLTFGNASTLRPYAPFSRGERARIAKAVQLALIQITGAGVLIDDEGLSGLDPAGVNTVLDFMVESGVETFFLVSHDPSVGDYLRKYPTIVVVKEDEIGTATIEK